MNQLSLITTGKHKIKEQKELTDVQKYVFYFLLFSFLGWCLETVYSFIVLGHFTNRGFLYGPVCPIYGFGGIILLTFLNNTKHTPIKFFVYSIIVFTIFEYAAGYCVDALYSISLWDYHNDKFNINGRIALFYSICWGIMALIFGYLIFPLIKKVGSFISSKIPVLLQIIVIYIFSAIFIIDSLYSFIEYSNISF